MTQNDEPFLLRWSRRKADARITDPSAPAVLSPELAEPATATELNDPDIEPAPGKVVEQNQPALAPSKSMLTDRDFADVDFDALGYDSDYGRFMQANVPDSIRKKALHKLWESDQMFTQVDPFQDYAGDYTDKAVAIPGVIIKTAYQYGRGFLSDEDVAAWDKLGKPNQDLAPDQPEVHAFLEASDQYAAALYPAESNHLVDMSVLLAASTRFVVARSSKVAVGCGAIVICQDADGANYGEIKRMWVEPASRRQKVGERVLAELLVLAKAEGLGSLRLETGISQPEALALYRKVGFTARAPFGSYVADPLSVFMQMDLV
jgi:putative acetyltransferase